MGEVVIIVSSLKDGVGSLKVENESTGAVSVALDSQSDRLEDEPAS